MLATPDFRADRPDGAAGRSAAAGSAGVGRAHHPAVRPQSTRTDPARFYSQRAEPVRGEPARADPGPHGRAGSGPGPAAAATGTDLAVGIGDDDEDERTQPQQRRPVRAARTTVVLDVRQASYSSVMAGMAPEWFQLAVDATASVALTAARTSFPVHLRTTAVGDGPARAGDWSNVGEVLDWLALARIAPDGSLRSALAAAGRGRTSGELVVVTGTGLTGADRDLVDEAVDSFDQVLLIQIGPEPPEQSAGRRPNEKVRTLWARDTESLVLGWVNLVSR